MSVPGRVSSTPLGSIGSITITAKVFVGNLSFDTQSNELQSLFSEVGHVVEVFLPTDRATGRPRGFAFVEFDDDNAAADAVKKYDGYELRGRNLRVNAAEARPPRPNFSPGGGGGAPGGGGGFSRPKGSRRNVRSKKRSL